MHDPRIGRFFAVDPLAPKYPHNSPYAFSENNVIAFIELEGLERVYYLVRRIKQSDGSTVITKVYSHTVEGFTNSKGEYEKYDEQYILRDYDGPFSQDRVFDTEEELKNFKFDYFGLLLKPSEGVVGDIIIQTLSEGSGEYGDRIQGSINLLEILDRREWRKFKRENKINVIVGSFSSKENALKFAKGLEEEYEDINLQVGILKPVGKDGYYRVSIGAFDYDDYADAVALRNLARNLGGVSDAWTVNTTNKQINEAIDVK